MVTGTWFPLKAYASTWFVGFHGAGPENPSCQSYPWANVDQGGGGAKTLDEIFVQVTWWIEPKLVSIGLASPETLERSQTFGLLKLKRYEQQNATIELYIHEKLPSRKLTCPLKGDHFKRKLVFQPSFITFSMLVFGGVFEPKKSSDESRCSRVYLPQFQDWFGVTEVELCNHKIRQMMSDRILATLGPRDHFPSHLLPGSLWRQRTSWNKKRHKTIPMAILRGKLTFCS